MKAKATILIVDDEEDIRLNLRDCAELEGYQVLEAGNGQEALDCVQSQSPQIVISDLMMPIMDGMQLLEEIEKRQIEIPVVVMTAFGTIEYAVNAMKRGAADFITKPIDLDYMMRVIRRVLKTSELERKVKEQQRQINEDLNLAASIQRCMLPQPVDTPELSLNFYFQPLVGIGGDYLTVHQFNSKKIAVAVYDVCGHGVSAALIANVVHNQMQMRLAEDRPPANAVDLLNRFITKNIAQTGMFITVVVAVIDMEDGFLTAFNAGHPEILVWKNETKSLETISSHVMPVGFKANILADESEAKVPLSSGDRILMYTDGFPETRNAEGVMLGLQGVKKIVETHIPKNSTDLLDAISTELKACRKGDPDDDYTLVIVDIK